jgi:hypothetical protein
MTESMVPEPLWKASYRIPEGNLLPLRERLTALNKKALKLAVPPILLTETGRADEPYTVKTAFGPETRYRTWVTVDLEGVAPKLAGYTFVATLDHATEAGVILRTVPGESLPASYREAAPVCEHCGTIRRRTETFVVRDAAGTLKQVGRNCLADFLGHKDPHAIAAWATLLGAFATVVSGAEEEGFFGGGYGGSSKVGVGYFTAVTVAMIERWGWLGRAKARETEGWATADRVTGYIFAKTEKDREHFKIAVTDAHEAEAAAVIEWARGLRAARGAELSDYEHNLVVVLEGEALDLKNAGIAASAVTAYRRTIERAIEARERAAGEATSDYFGTPGKRAVFTLTVLACIETEGGLYGPTFIYKFRDAAGNRATWFSSRFIGELTPGSTWRIKATVKAHEPYKGCKQTVLTRGAVEGPAEPSNGQEAA